MTALSPKMIQNLAEKTAKDAGFTALPICPVKIAEHHEIVVQPKADTEPGVSGILVRAGDHFGILYSTYVENDGFQRFSIAHELGHYFLEGHPEAVIKNGQHMSRAGFVSKDRYEREADCFAAALLMPEDLFRAEVRRRDCGLDAIIAISDLAVTSLSATAFRFTELTRDAVAVILSEGPTIISCQYSDAMKGLAPKGERMPFLYGAAVPNRTTTASLSGDPARVRNRDRDETDIDISDWFGVGVGIRGTEEVIGLGRYGRTLTVVRCEAPSEDDYDPEEEADDDEYLKERWTPRFRK